MTFNGINYLSYLLNLYHVLQSRESSKSSIRAAQDSRRTAGPFKQRVRHTSPITSGGPAIQDFGDNMSETNPTAQETVEVALSGTGGVVKTLTDLRFEKLEARFAQLEKENAELRQANAELYAFAKSKESVAAPAPAAASAPAPAAPVAAVTVQDPAAEQAAAQAKQDEDSILAAALAKLGYVKNENKDDGM